MHPLRFNPRTLLKAAISFETSALLYEQVVYLPNFLLGDPQRAGSHFSALHSVSSPGHFHGIAALAIAAGMAALWLSPCRPENRNDLRRLTTVVLLSGGLSLFAIAQLNGPLFFESPPSDLPEHVLRLAWIWSGLNLTRVALLGLGLRLACRLRD
jgi:hypothetical protein